MVFEFVDDVNEDSEDDDSVYLIPLFCCTAATVGYEVETISSFDVLLLYNIFFDFLCIYVYFQLTSIISSASLSCSENVVGQCDAALFTFTFSLLDLIKSVFLYYTDIGLLVCDKSCPWLVLASEIVEAV